LNPHSQPKDDTMNSAKQYPLSVSLIHWLVAITIIGNLAIGWMLDDSMDLMALHKSIGALILALAAVRLANLLARRKALPPSLNAKGSLSHFAEKMVHGLLYLGMITIPVLGWLKTNAAGHDVSVFGLFAIPAFIEKNRPLSHLLGSLHAAFALAFAGVLGLHVLAALAHCRNKSGSIFQRILPFRARRSLS